MTAARADGVGREGARRFCREALPSVSRTFALTIRVLPEPLRDPVTVAYLLCRMADVLEDATGSDPTRRIAELEAMADALFHPSRSARDLAAVLDGAEELVPDDPAGRELLRNRGAVFQAYLDLPAAEREIVSRWVQAMALGMATFVGRERRADVPGAVVVGTRVPHVLATQEELRAYAWYVAGTVGHLLTELFERHCGPRWPDRERMRELCAPFGLGLQFTNILQDLADDRRRGWSYVPEELARGCGTSVQELDDPREVGAALHVVDHLVREAAQYLDSAMEYTLLLPRRTPRLRLFCLWPAFFAVRTLVRIWGERQVLVGGDRVRISRPEVRRVIGLTTSLCWSDGALRALWTGEKERLRRKMDALSV
jgi:farnesyl-diphosphate farnesyltransferase